MKGVVPGRTVAFDTAPEDASPASRLLGVGRVLSLTEDRTTVSLHLYKARANGQLQVVWEPSFTKPADAEHEEQELISVPASRILGLADLSSKGVLSYGTANRLHRAGWRIAESVVRSGGLAAAAVSTVPASPESLDSTSRASKLLATSNPADDFEFTISAIQRWAHGGALFVEIYDGVGRLSTSIATLGWPVAPGVDRCRITYGKRWDLQLESHRSHLRYLLFKVLEPAGIH